MRIAFITAISACWMLLWIYWLVSAFRAKKSRPMGGQLIGFRAVLAGLIVVLAILFRLLPDSLRRQPLVAGAPWLIAGLLIFVLGMGLAMWARASMGRNWGMPMTTREEPELVTSGIYRYVRHPIYGGILAMSLGSAIVIGAFWPMVFVVFAAYFVYSATVEEKLMTNQFPEQYPAYRRRTKMLIPFLF